MRHCLFILAIPALLASAAPLTESDALEYNRLLLDKWRGDPEHYQRLKRDLRAFWAMPPARQEAMRRLDRDLHALDKPRQKHLWRALERYSAWLDRLREQSPADFARIEAAASPRERLQIIRAIRERQWFESLPQKVRDGLMKLPEAERDQRLAQLRREERKQRAAWMHVPRHLPPWRGGKPTRLRDFPPEVQDFVRDRLMPLLSTDEKARLSRVEGKWPQLARTILDLSEKHPILPPPPPPRVAATRYRELPPEAKQLLPPTVLRNRKRWHALHRAEGRWPDFALAFMDVLRQEKKSLKQPLGASRPEEMPPAVREFLTHRLRFELTGSEAQQLEHAEGKWPDYPRLLLHLSHKHHLAVPGMSLPGPRELWEAVRKPS